MEEIDGNETEYLKKFVITVVIHIEKYLIFISFITWIFHASKVPVFIVTEPHRRTDKIHKNISSSLSTPSIVAERFFSH